MFFSLLLWFSEEGRRERRAENCGRSESPGWAEKQKDGQKVRDQPESRRRATKGVADESDQCYNSVIIFGLFPAARKPDPEKKGASNV